MQFFQLYKLYKTDVEYICVPYANKLGKAPELFLLTVPNFMLTK